MKIQKTQVAWFILGMAATGALVFILQIMLGAATTTDRIATRQTTNSEKIDTSAQTLALVRDCVTPGGKCFDEGQKRSSGIVNALNQGSAAAAAAAAACADRPGVSGYRAIKACVDATLADQR